MPALALRRTYPAPISAPSEVTRKSGWLSADFDGLGSISIATLIVSVFSSPSRPPFGWHATYRKGGGDRRFGRPWRGRRTDDELIRAWLRPPRPS